MTIKRGFLLGKFLPPHSGHQFLCDFASHYCDELTILVCSIKDEPIPGDLRHKWMAELYPNARVMHCAEDVPQEPADHPDFWQIWRDIVRRFHREPIDYVFASETYGARLADEVGARFIPVDLARTACPVSGSAVRQDPGKYWQFIAPPARQYFSRVVCLHGPECSGKTTLAARLAKHFETVLAPEYGRTYTELFGIDCSNDDLLHIARGQTASISAAQNQARGFVISDTDAVLTAVWSDMLLGQRDPSFKSVPTSDLYLLTDVDFDWVDDGTRYFSNAQKRQQFFHACAEELEQRELPYVRLSGDEGNRFRDAVAAIEQSFPNLIPR